MLKSLLWDNLPYLFPQAPAQPPTLRQRRLTALADQIERLAGDFDMGCSRHCAYGHACRLFGEVFLPSHADHVGELARMLCIPWDEAYRLYWGAEQTPPIATGKDMAAALRALAARPEPVKPDRPPAARAGRAPRAFIVEHRRTERRRGGLPPPVRVRMLEEA